MTNSASRSDSMERGGREPGRPDLVTRAQLILLARTLHVPAERLTHLNRLGAAQLHDLQQRMARVIFDEHAATFKRLSMLVPIIPLSISIPLVQRIVPPMMGGRAAGAVGVVHPKKAAEAVGMLNPKYAADCAPHIDPHTVGQLAVVAPPEPIVRIANELMRRKDYVTIGPLLAYATTPLIRAIEAGVPDDAGLIMSAAYAYSAPNISAIVRQLLTGPLDRIPGILETILAGSTELRLAAISAFARCDEDVIEALGDVLFEIGAPEAVTDLATTLIADGAIDDMLRFTAALSPSALDTLAANPITADRAAMSALVAAVAYVTDPVLWRGLLALVERTDVEVRRRTSAQLIELPEPTLAALPLIATKGRLWSPLLRVLAATDADTQVRLGELWAKLPAEERTDIERHARDLGLFTQLASLTVTLDIYG
ncbi:hypothetical protein OG874_13260 [Nocardia sp. NBC_00565]|uniref:hypothetical protein n=1 Tax=Nocardia sp. NBC_00565 TaxID=2975993 RepID=UPI002E80E0C8|nr:hypothetical protein [Nocardia sp. NBC_00565]WUC06039.1 hypothetical protein OG874_13260 [Nocardia sp. NBC_00565]